MAPSMSRNIRKRPNLVQFLIIVFDNLVLKCPFFSSGVISYTGVTFVSGNRDKKKKTPNILVNFFYFYQSMFLVRIGF